MTSNDVADALLHRLDHRGSERRGEDATAALSFDMDFDSARSWPDLPFDTSAPPSRYADESRPELLQIIGRAADIFHSRAPRAWTFVDEQLDRVMARRSSAVAGASSSSNRALVGVCLLTNLEQAPDRDYVCVEALVHEATHQYLYRTELARGNFCDLGEARTYRSPWSGNRIPLHSLIHATFVWFGLLTLWCQLARSLTDDHESAIVRERVARALFGFEFIGEIMRSRSFPSASVQAQILDLIERMTLVAPDIGRGAGHRTIGETIARCEEGGWVPQLAESIERVVRD